MCACGLQRNKRSVLVEDPIRKDSELIARQGPERKRNGGIGSCILTFDPRVLFTGVVIQRTETHFGSYRPPPVTRLRSLVFLCCWFECLIGFNR
jgi:hypothetical protein